MLVDGPQFYGVICNRNNGLFNDELCYILYCTMKMGENNEILLKSGLKLDLVAHCISVCRKSRLNGSIPQMIPQKPRPRVTAGVAR